MWFIKLLLLTLKVLISLNIEFLIFEKHFQWICSLLQIFDVSLCVQDSPVLAYFQKDILRKPFAS